MAHPSKLRSENPVAEKVCKLYAKGLGLRTVAEEVGKSGAWVRSVLVLNGLEIKPRGRPKSS